MNSRTVCVASAVVAIGVSGMIVWARHSGDGTGRPPASPSPGEPVAVPSRTAVVPTTPLPERETWDVLRISGVRAGYVRSSIRHATESGSRVIKIEQAMHLAVQRFGQTTEQDIRFSSTETPAGALLDFRTEIRQGPIPLVTTGRVTGDRLQLRTSTQGKTVESSIAWPADCGGVAASEHSLLRQPMKPGEKRTVRHLGADNEIGETQMEAKQFERVELLGGAFELLRIDTVERLSTGQKLKGAVWTDRSGEVLKTWIEMMNMEMLRTTKDIALAKTELAKLDLGEGVSVKIDRPLPKVHEAKQLRYRVTLKDGNPAEVFVTGPTQQVKRLDTHTAEITVYAVRPGQRDGNPDAPADEPTDADRQANNFIQSDDARIVADAREAAGKETEPWRVAVALERYVHGAVKLKDFTHAFATAAEVAKTREGDCTEHAVYLAALARARGIPARVAVGLVYMSRSQAFGYHMWTEVYIDRCWVPIDGTLALGGIGGGHLKLAQSNMEGAKAYSSFLPVLQAIGKLKIEVE